MWKKVLSNGFGVPSAYVLPLCIVIGMDTDACQLVLCGVPVFFKLPGSKSADLGGRTESEQQY